MEQRRVIVVLSLAIALTRLLAIAQSLFDWDEALFALGVRDFDVTQHHPHPPGYPLFIVAAKVLDALGVSEFRSLQVIVVCGSLFVFPALYWLARELGFDFTTAAAGAALYAFLPNVWIYGGTAFSDVPATVFAFVACALLLRGRRDARAYVLGAIVLGIAAGFRLPNLLLGAIPALLATWSQRRRWRLVLLAMFAGACVVLIAYGGAALASHSVDGYLEAIRLQSEYVRNVDSWRNPGREPLYDAAKTFFVRPFQHRDVLRGIVLFAAIGFLGALGGRAAGPPFRGLPARAPLLTAALFAPLAIVTWVSFDINGPSRYAIGYMAVHALLAAEGFRVVGRKPALQVALCVIAIGVCVAGTWGALREQRESDAPPVAALRHVAVHADPNATVYIHGSMQPQAELLLPRRKKVFFGEAGEIPRDDASAWFVDARVQPGGEKFVRGRRDSWRVLRHRNFEATAGRVAELPAR